MNPEQFQRVEAALARIEEGLRVLARSSLPTRDLPTVLSLEHAAAELGGISPQTVRRMIRAGDIRTVRISKREGIPRDEIERIARGEHSPNSRTAKESRAKAKSVSFSEAAFKVVLKKF